LRIPKKQLYTLSTWALILIAVVVWGQFLLFPKHRGAKIESATSPASLVPQISVRPPVSSYHLFGASKTTEIALNPALAGETGLDLIITGTFASNTKQRGQAYIRQPGGDEKMFQVGDQVFNVAKLSAVYPDYVLLNRNGRQEKLSLSKNRLQSNQQSNPQSSHTTNQNDSEAVDVAARNRQFINKGNNWQEALNQTKFDASKISKIAGNVSVVTNQSGQIAGLKVSALSASDALTRQGLQSNDRIIAVNGVAIANDNLFTIKQQLEQGERATVTVNRNGREISLNLNLSEFK
jgi:type II secretion system protein C